MNIDYEYMASSIASLTGLPVRLYESDRFVHLYSHSSFLPDPAITEEKNIFAIHGNIGYCMTDTFLYYGLFRTADRNISFIIGPVSASPVRREMILPILRSIGESPKRMEEMYAWLNAMPSYPLRNFLQILCTVNYFINQQKIDVSDLLLNKETEYPVPDPLPAPQKEEEISIHNTMDLEHFLLQCVEQGDTESLKQLFHQPAAGRPGILAQDALRQEKNLFICTVTLVSRAAIRGGLSEETALSLSDVYIQKMELMSRYEDVSRLQAEAVMEYAKKVSELEAGVRSSRQVRKIRDYILDHLNEPLTTAQIADAVGMSRTWMCTAVQEQLGMSVKEYVMEIKLKEAKRLLSLSHKSLAEISDYLGFSSQSHFQNVFRKQTGMTPKQYRLNSR